MFFCRKRANVAVIDDETESYEDSSYTLEEETSSNCAWCGDPPNEYGSHGICSYHAEQMIEQARTRKRGR